MILLLLTHVKAMQNGLGQTQFFDFVIHKSKFYKVIACHSRFQHCSVIALHAEITKEESQKSN